jgi:hypothetical protein
MPNAYGGGAKHYHLPVNGSVVNHGVIMDNNGGESLFLYISGNISNNGEWVNHLTHVYVSNEQYIELIDDSPIVGAVVFDAVVQAESYQWYYDDAILDSDDFEGETAKVLTWNVPVSSEWYGSFYCETGERETVGIVIKKGYTDIHEKYACQAKIWSYDKYIYVDLAERERGKASVYDLMGKKIGCFNINQGLTSQYLDLTGFYIVQVSVDNKVANKKIYLR